MDDFRKVNVEDSVQGHIVIAGSDIRQITAAREYTREEEAEAMSIAHRRLHV
jgi:hypothetical protein